MSSPKLSQLVDIPIEIQSRCRDTPLSQYFIVETGGYFCDQYWSKGDVVVCDGTGSVGDVVVLITTGQGRPRLGGVLANELRGDLGEPCHPSRWLIAGRVRGVWQRKTIGWVFGSIGLSYSESCMVETASPIHRPIHSSLCSLSRRKREASRQLLLFSSAIAQAA